MSFPFTGIHSFGTRTNGIEVRVLQNTCHLPLAWSDSALHLWYSAEWSSIALPVFCVLHLLVDLLIDLDTENNYRNIKNCLSMRLSLLECVCKKQILVQCFSLYNVVLSLALILVFVSPCSFWTGGMHNITIKSELAVKPVTSVVLGLKV